MTPVTGDDETVIDDGSDRPAVAPVSPPRTFPARIGAYEVVAELGRGGMGVVYRARDVALGREVAIKVLLAHGATPEARRRLEVEARAAARLRHPNIVAVHAYGVDEATGDPYVVMELVRGRSLRDALRAGPLEPREAARLAEDLARALAAAHEQGVLHRDVKPHNVLLSPEGAPLLADFGLAKALDAADGPTSTGQVLGTPAYMSPEQADGDGGRVGPRSDVWSLGATLYELLTGRPPFVASTAMLTIAAVLRKDPTPPRRVRAGLDRDLETICLACLEKDPARRYASAAALADDLERWRRGQPIAARPVGRAERAWRAVARRPARAAAWTAVALLVAGAAASTWWAGREARALAALGEARALARRGRAADVLARVDGALDVGGRTSSLLIEAALTCEAGGLTDRAKLLLEEAAREHPPGDEALLELHRLTVADGHGSRITPALDRLIASADARGADDEFGAFARAERAIARGDFVEALAHFDRIDALGARFPWALVERADAHRELGDVAAARASLDRALAIDPELAAAWASRGGLRHDQGDLAGARADLDRAVALDPALATAWLLRGLVRRRAGDLAGAKDDLTRALELAPDHVRANLAHLALGELALREWGRAPGRATDAPALRTALANLERAVALDAGHALAWALRAEALAGRGDALGARRDYARALELEPGRKETWYERAVLHLELLDPPRALADLREALALDPGWADAYVRRALVRVSAGDVDGARVDVESALRLDPALGEPGEGVAREELRAVLEQLR
jgi:tetratricopeptide (TPR) repeat protein/predicted Ser/Thr protein kinase